MSMEASGERGSGPGSLGSETPRGWQIGAAPGWLSSRGRSEASDFMGFLLVPRVKFMLKVCTTNACRTPHASHLPTFSPSHLLSFLPFHHLPELPT